jgi:hypothetical protein
VSGAPSREDDAEKYSFVRLVARLAAIGPSLKMMELAIGEDQHLNIDIPKTISYWRMLVDHAGVTEALLRHQYAGSGSEDDPYAISWIANDSRNPMEFSMTQKIFMTSVVGIATLIVSFTSSAYIGSVKKVEKYFAVGDEIATLGLSLFVLRFALVRCSGFEVCTQTS